MKPELKARLCGEDKSFFAPGRSPVLSAHGAVATSHPLASAEALQILRQGGSAADAAIAAAAILCVAEPHMTGVGGDVFALAKRANSPGAPASLDGSGWLPAAFSPPSSGAIPETSPLAVTVPGATAAWEKLHQRFGKLAWRDVLAPAVRAASDGVPLAPRVARDWQKESARLLPDADARQFFLPEGKAPRVGDLHRNPNLARTLENIAQNGAAAFYRGDIARDIVAKLNSLGGAHSESDFAEYYENGAQWREPASLEYRGWTVWECPPSAQGLAALLMLRALRERDLAAATPENRALLFANICRRAYQWRDANIGDNFPSGDFAAVLESVRRESFPPQGAEHRDTVYLAAADSDGLLVSFINSLFHPFGGGIYIPQSGVLLHNRGAAFSPRPESPNAPGPRRRPLHTLLPGMAENADGDILSFGVMGGNYQAAGHAWFLMNLLDLGADLQTALDAPRIFAFPPETSELQIEPGFSRPTRLALRRAGWKLKNAPDPLGGGQAALRFADGLIASASDARKDGAATGY